MRLDTGAISDALDRLNHPHGVAEHLHGIFPERRLCGRIRTIALAPADAHTSNSFHLGTRTIASSKPGEVIVVANEGRIQAAAWGGMLSIAANLRQLPGVIVDGAIRDLDQIESLDFTIFARAACPRTARRRFVEVAIDQPIQIDGVRVETGDLVLADRSGVVFIPEATHAAIISTAEEIFEMEASLMEQLRSEADVETVFGRTYEHLTHPPAKSD